MLPRPYVLRAEAAWERAKPQGPLTAEGTALAHPVSGRAAPFALFFLSLPRWFFPCPNPNKFSFLDKILPAPVLGTGYRYISPYVTGTFSEFEHHLKSELMVYQARINL